MNLNPCNPFRLNKIAFFPSQLECQFFCRLKAGALRPPDNRLKCIESLHDHLLMNLSGKSVE